ncbi:MAG: phosphoglucosamine mutase [Clostridia bacterium]|nr:phosphoglucosamine mutase [Clostridia bacterium]MBO5338909.1 phosphoglucosamine mutase [Clostridia bacterium]
MGKYFGTDGFRGKAGEELLATHAFKIGRFLGKYLKSEGKTRAVIGKDTRLSSYMLEYAMASGLCSVGADAYMLHVTTTPCVSYTVVNDHFDIGVMISASHNPYYDNGIKLINSNGEKIDEELISKIEAFLDSEETQEIKSGKELGRIIDYSEGRNRYIAYLIGSSSLSFKGLRIGLDPANGAGFMIAKSVFGALGAKVYMINDSPNGTNINCECGSTNTGGLSELVKKAGLDMGFAYDGDSDRCIAVDEHGCEVDGDKIMYILARNLKNKGELLGNTIVTTVMSNMGLYDALGEMGISHKETRVGDFYVYEEIKKGGYSLGGEQSGHIILSKYATTGDGILTSIKLTEAILESKSTLSVEAKDVVPYAQETKNVNVKNKEELLSLPKVKDAIKEAGEEFCRGDGRILVRPSGTEPLIRIMVESKSEEKLKRVLNKLFDIISSEAKK